MSKQSQIDKAIAAIDAEIEVLRQVKERLVAQMGTKPVKRSKPRAVKPVESQSA